MSPGPPRQMRPGRSWVPAIRTPRLCRPCATSKQRCTNIWQKVAQAHGEVFGEIRPATTMVEVSRLIAPEILVEIEADAVIAESDG